MLKYLITENLDGDHIVARSLEPGHPHVEMRLGKQEEDILLLRPSWVVLWLQDKTLSREQILDLLVMATETEQKTMEISFCNP